MDSKIINKISNKQEWNFLYAKNQEKIWIEIKRNLYHWEKAGRPDPTTYFTDGLNRWIALLLLKETMHNTGDTTNG